MGTAEMRTGSLGELLRRHSLVLLVLTALQGVVGWLGASAYLEARNTLERNGRWTSTKGSLEKGVVGARSFFRGREALAGRRLNLQAWHGYHEISSAEPVVAPKTLEFEAGLAEHGILYAFFNRNGTDPYHAVRLSTVQRSTSAFLTVDEEGRFLARETLQDVVLRPGVYRVRLGFEKDRLSVSVDGHLLGTFAIARLARQRVGFRSSRAPVWIDDVVVKAADGTGFAEHFAGPRGATGTRTAVVLTSVLAAPGIFLLLVARRLDRGRVVAFAMLTASLTLLAVLGMTLVYLRARAHWYPQADETLLAREELFRQAEVGRVLADLKTQSEESRRRRNPSILFVGSSQTWGAGALRAEDTFVARIEALFAASPRGGPRVTCANLGVPAARARDLVPLLAAVRRTLRPALVVINLGANDRGSRNFATKLERLIVLASKGGSDVVLVKEANSPFGVDRELSARHRDVAEVARRRGVQVVDLHGHLASLADTGFLWWDLVHLTSYGHRLAADYLFEALRPLVAGSKPAETDPGNGGPARDARDRVS